MQDRDARIIVADALRIQLLALSDDCNFLIVPPAISARQKARIESYIAVAKAEAVASAHSRRAAEQLAASQVLTQVEHWLRHGH